MYSNTADWDQLLLLKFSGSQDDVRTCVSGLGPVQTAARRDPRLWREGRDKMEDLWLRWQEKRSVVRA